jgi:hypothetical protein
MLPRMATRKPAATHTRKAAPSKAADPAGAKPAARKRVTSKTQAAGKAPAARKRPALARKPAHATRPGKTPRPQAPAVADAVTPQDLPKRRLTAAERERRFNLLLQTTCLKAGTAAAISAISSKVPLLGRLAPLVLGSVGETLVLAKVQEQLVRETIALYQLELSEPEERGVILLATAVNIGAQQISKETVEQLIEQVTGRLYQPLISRMLPLASVATEVAAAVASTYAVGKRAQALCRLPGTGARDLGELLRGMSGIDEIKLYKWTGDAFALAMKPFRGVLLSMVPGFGGKRR